MLFARVRRHDPIQHQRKSGTDVLDLSCAMLNDYFQRQRQNADAETSPIECRFPVQPDSFFEFRGTSAPNPIESQRLRKPDANICASQAAHVFGAFAVDRHRIAICCARVKRKVRNMASSKRKTAKKSGAAKGRTPAKESRKHPSPGALPRLARKRPRRASPTTESAPAGATPTQARQRARADPKPHYEAPHYAGANKLKDKVALITGGDSGMGRAVAVLVSTLLGGDTTAG